MVIQKFSGRSDPVKRLFLPINLFNGAIAAALLMVLYIVSLRNYLLFHVTVEIAGIAVAFSIFIIIWNTRRVITDAFFLIIGISFFFIGSIDLVHMFTFRGMAIFSGDSANISAQLWIAARYLQSVMFIIATVLIGKSLTKERRYDAAIIIAACTAVCILLFASIFVWQDFPACFVEGGGLTPFKIISEYVIALILVVTIILLYLKREHFDPAVWKFLIAAQAFLILGELAFASYRDVYGSINMLGHVFRLLSAYFFYRAFVVTSLTRPYNLLLMKLRMEEHELRERFKELICMFRISSLMELPEVSLPEIMETTIQLIPAAMQFPDIAEARIIVEGQTFQTAPFPETTGTVAREIRVNGNPAGRVEVWYREERPAGHEGPFSKEECDLVNAIAERVGLFIERSRARDALRASEEKFHRFIDFTYDWEYWVAPDGTILYSSPSCERITGYSMQEFRDSPGLVTDIILPEDRKTWLQHDQTAKSSTEARSLDFRIRHRDGTVRWIAHRSMPVYDAQNRYVGRRVSNRDITEQKNTEEALVKSERRYRSFVQSFRGIAYLSTLDWTPVFFHGAVEEITGYTEQDFTTGSIRWDQVILPDDLAEIQKRDSKKLLTVPGCSIQREYRITRKDGHVCWVSDFIQNWTDERGDIFLSGVLFDITERKRNEEALRESRALLATTQRLAKMGGWEWDVVQQTMTWTEETYRIHGFMPGDIADGSADHIHRSLTCYDPRDRPVIEGAFRACSEQGVPYDKEVPFTRADGRRIWVRTMAQPVYQNGRIVKVVGNIMDITGRKRAEEALRAANKKLNLLSGITRHDIKNQLITLSGFLAVSKRSLSDPAAIANFIEKEEKAASAIARQISFTKDYEDLGVKSAIWQDISALVMSAAAELPMQNIAVDIRCSGFEVFADPLLGKVFYNLIDNSLHYGGEKMTTIRISIDEPQEELRIVCEDDGNGVSPDDKQQLFTKGFGKHTGLGLFLSREILSITGITITENGEPGKGARFEIVVPAGTWRYF